MKKMNKYMKTTIITVIILALFTIAQRDKIIGYFEPKCIEEGCTEKVVEGTNYCRWHLISDDNDYDDDSDYTQETTSDNKVYKYHKPMMMAMMIFMMMGTMITTDMTMMRIMLKV